ncbi:MAG: hypothetical protein ACE5I2_07400 [Anaerolineae bacterium]
MKDYDSRLRAFAELGPLTSMEVIEIVHDRLYAIYGEDMGVYTEGRKRCDCCGNPRLKRRFPVQDRSGKVHLIGMKCRDNLIVRGALTRLYLSSRPLQYAVDKNGQPVEKKLVDAPHE